MGIWVALSPEKIGYGYCASSGQEQYSFVQAGYNIFVTPSNSFYLEYFVTTINNKHTVNNYDANVPGEGTITRLDVTVSNLENGTAMAQFFVAFSDGSTWSTTVYVSIPGTLTGSAMSIVEAPQTPNGHYYELPLINGGMINFNFEYIGEDGNEHIGPSTNPSGTIYADVYQIGSSSTYNNAYAQIYNGWAYDGGGWSYLYQFTYPWLGDT